MLVGTVHAGSSVHWVLPAACDQSLEEMLG